jgi:hypothetical protein
MWSPLLPDGYGFTFDDNAHVFGLAVEPKADEFLKQGARCFDDLVQINLKEILCTACASLLNSIHPGKLCFFLSYIAVY